MIQLTDPLLVSAPRPRRRYLSSARRKEEILDAALIEFSSNGYAAATIERIAMRAGLSKAGLYAHYKGKDKIFEDLLASFLVPLSFGRSWLPEGGASVREAIDAFIDQAYSKLDDPNILAMLRLLISESGRAPSLVRRWRDEVLQPHFDAQQRMIDECVERGIMRRNGLTRHFSLIVSPVLCAALLRIIFGDADVQQEVMQVREVHRELLIELLGP